MRIIEALRVHDAAAAKRAMRAHVRAAGARLLEGLRQAQSPAASAGADGSP
ncbi:MAG: hypothetical protein HY332_24385 [Chloroflexi bacterium]|nr:hypothetical protein [Chloroflexota bacterium]